MIQANLFSDTVPPWEGRASNGEPKLWVKEFLIFRDTTTAEFEIVRQITFRRGLNVIWTPNMLDSDLTGHTAGKSLLVSLIRHLLSNKGEVPELRSFRNAYPNGGIGAVVGLNQQEWRLFKTFRTGECGSATRSGSFTASEPAGWTTFTKEMSSLNGAEEVDTANIIPWLSRDQRCRYSQLWNWQPDDNKANNLDAIFRTLHLRNPAVEPLEQELSRLKEAIAQLKSARERSLRQVLFYRAELEIADPSTPSPTTSFDFENRIQKLQHKVDSLKKERKDLDRDSLFTEERELADILSTLNAYRKVRAQNHTKIQILEAQIRQGKFDAPVAQDENRDPNRHLCLMPMITARALCPLARTEMATPIAYMSNKRSQIDTEEDAKREIEKCEAQILAIEEVIKEREFAEVSKRRELMVRRTKANWERDRISESLGDLMSEFRAVHKLREEEQKYWSTSLRIQKAELQREANKKEIAELEDERKDVLAHLSEVFNHVVKFVVANSVSGAVSRENADLQLEISQDDAARASVAVDSIRVPLFDIAALIHSLLGRGALPPFLIHDSIREADLAENIYHCAFRLLHLLEEGIAEPDFQYIILTTTPPPAEMQTEPWLRARMAAHPAHERLCRVDFYQSKEF